MRSLTLMMPLIMPMALVGCLGALAGCDMGLLPPSTALVEEMARIEAERLDAHDENISEHFKIQTPDLADDFDAQRALFTQRMEGFDKQLAEARAVQEKAWQQMLDNAAELAGLPSFMANMWRPEMDAAKDEANNAASAAEIVGMKLEHLKALQPTPAEMKALKSITTGEILALLAAAGGVAGVGIVSGKSGKSRSQPEIDKLREVVSGITAEIERAKPPLTA